MRKAVPFEDLFGGGGGISYPEKVDPYRRAAEVAEEKTSGVRRFGRRNIFERERIQTLSDLPQSDFRYSSPDPDRVSFGLIFLIFLSKTSKPMSDVKVLTKHIQCSPCMSSLFTQLQN